MTTDEIVLVEDNEDDIAVALRALGRDVEDCRVLVLRDGREALDWIESLERKAGQAPKVIFLDLRLPRLDGRKVLQALRRSPATQAVPVVIVSSASIESEIDDCYRLGANSFIAKKYGGERPGKYIVEAARYWIYLNRPPHSGS